MHHLFLVPEIVAVIVKSGCLYKGFLYTCLLVNRVFFQESARLLWYGCGGSFWKDSVAGHVMADIVHLGSVNRKDPQRAQMYANFIVILQFSEWFDGDEEERSEPEWHHELLSLQFPQLQRLRFILGDGAPCLDTEHGLAHYAQPNVIDLYITMNSQLSDIFLDTLSSKCPRLMYLNLSDCANNMVTREGLLRFLHRSKQIKALHLDDVLDELWSEHIFHVIEQLPNLGGVGLPYIEESWLEEVTGFRALTSLQTSVPNRGLALLAASLPHLLDVELNFQSPYPSFSVVANFTRLHTLNLRFPRDSSFDAQHLLLIAQRCPDLKNVKIGDDPGHRPGTSGLNDEFMEELACRLPRLFSLCLKIETNEEPMTFRSVQSLCRLCPKLSDLMLGPIIIDWSKIQDDAGDTSGRTVLSETLGGLHLVLHQDQQPLPYNEELEDNQAQCDRIFQLATNFTSLFPRMSAFDLEGDGKREGEKQLEKQMSKSCESRKHYF